MRLERNFNHVITREKTSIHSIDHRYDVDEDVNEDNNVHDVLVVRNGSHSLSNTHVRTENRRSKHTHTHTPLNAGTRERRRRRRRRR